MQFHNAIVGCRQQGLTKFAKYVDHFVVLTCDLEVKGLELPHRVSSKTIYSGYDPVIEQLPKWLHELLRTLVVQHYLTALFYDRGVLEGQFRLKLELTWPIRKQTSESRLYDTTVVMLDELGYEQGNLETDVDLSRVWLNAMKWANNATV